MDRTESTPTALCEPTVAVSSDTDSPTEPSLVETLFEFVHSIDLSGKDLAPKLEALHAEHGDVVYAELIHLLSHLRFAPEEARRYWKRVEVHRQGMENKIGGPVDLRVALLSYFVEVQCRLQNPMIIEMRLFQQTCESAYMDDLTGLRNYRLFNEHLAQEIQQAARSSSPLSLVMLDVDDFKHYNDTHGHVAGNDILREIAGLLKSSLRAMDIAVRYGGEEFALILPGTPKLAARLVAERTRKLIESNSFPGGDRQPRGCLTISLGVATFPGDATDPKELVRRADRALYVAKDRGKNRMHLYGSCRRSFRRVEATLNGQYGTITTECRPLTTVNIGEGGLLFMVDRSLPVGTLVDVTMNLPDDGRSIGATGRVVRSEQRNDGTYETALRIVEMSNSDRHALSGLIAETAPENVTQEA